jgi:hypothetical protein
MYSVCFPLNARSPGRLEGLPKPQEQEEYRRKARRPYSLLSSGKRLRLCHYQISTASHLLQWPRTHSHRWSSRTQRQWPLIHLTLLKGRVPAGGSTRSGGFGGRGGFRLFIRESPKRLGIPPKVCPHARIATAHGQQRHRLRTAHRE